MEEKIKYISKYIKYRKNVNVKIHLPKNIFQKSLLERAYRYAKAFTRDKQIKL